MIIRRGVLFTPYCSGFVMAQYLRHTVRYISAENVGGGGAEMRAFLHRLIKSGSNISKTMRNDSGR